MFSKIYSGGLLGIEGYLVEVEADVSGGLPGFHMVGCLASEVKEAEERVRTAIQNSGFRLSSRKVTINLSPANVRKDGTGWDLAVAVAVLAAYEIVKPDILKDTAFLGELGLDGRIKPVRGVLSLMMSLEKAGIRRCFLAEENVKEGVAAQTLEIVKVRNLRELTTLLNAPEEIQVEPFCEDSEPIKSYSVDFSEVHGQSLVRRATEVAVAGRHNILYIGPPGSGKSMMARRIPTIMPELSRKEQLEVSQIYSICGLLPDGGSLMKIRPFRSPHHSISTQALTGGGRMPKPGEISLASRGVLFLDELPEFQKKTLETLRQPMEDRKITISRVFGTCEFPAHFMLAAAMNPCPCGYYPDRSRCSCTTYQVHQYLRKISRPMLDRIDICVEAAAVSFQDIRNGAEGESSQDIRKRVEAARSIQAERFSGTGIFFNCEMGEREIRRYCGLQSKDEAFLRQVFEGRGLSARGCHKILRVARTIADLEGEEKINRNHLIEAVGYRELEEQYWGGGIAGGT